MCTTMEASSAEADEDSTDSKDCLPWSTSLQRMKFLQSASGSFSTSASEVEEKARTPALELNQDRYMEIERRQAEKNGSRAEGNCRCQQRKYPRVHALALVSPVGRIHPSMSKEVHEHPLLRRGTELLATALEHLVQDQHLSIQMTAASSAPAALAQSRLARGTSRLA